jgi:hypothetical protein
MSTSQITITIYVVSLIIGVVLWKRGWTNIRRHDETVEESKKVKQDANPMAHR